MSGSWNERYNARSESILVSGKSNRIDPEKWRPLITSFQQFFGLGSALHPSKFSQFPEETFSPNQHQPALDSLGTADVNLRVA